MFKEFYAKAKSDAANVDMKSYVNSAKSSVGSLSGKLDERRQKMAEMRKQMLDGDKKDATKD